MNRNRINLIIDIVMFLLMMAAGGIGFLLKFVLVTGQERWAMYHQKVELLFWGMDRHQWAWIHLIFGVLLLVLLILHIVFHWKQICCMACQLIRSGCIRVPAAWLLGAAGLLLLLFPLLARVEIVPDAYGTGRQSHGLEREAETPDATGEAVSESPQHEGESLGITGQMSLADIEEAFRVPCSFLIEKLELPQGTDCRQRLGRLRKSHAFHMSDVETFIRNYQETAR